MTRRLVFATLGTFLLAGSAFAFEKSGGASDVPAPAGKALDLSSRSKSVQSEDEGTVVRIPGLGALGVLPKLDFGLELLYGDEQPQVVPREKDVPENDGLSIRGTLKHRF